MRRKTLDDMFKYIPSLSYKRKLAVAFAVYSDLPLDQVIYLKWTDEINVNWRALHILTKVSPCNETDFIFWEKTFDISGPAPMYSLKIMFDTLSPIEWGRFVDTFKESVPIDFNCAFASHR